MGFFGLLGRRSYDRPGFGLYRDVVAAARDPYFYERLGVPDTLDGRFDVVGLHASLLIRRLRFLPPPGPDLAQGLFDAMFNDMDVNLRELGVSDLSVGKRVRAMWEAFHGRAQAYEAALSADDRQALAAAIARNVWRGAAGPSGSAASLARLAVAQDGHLATQSLDSFTTGRAHFLPASAAAA